MSKQNYSQTFPENSKIFVGNFDNIVVPKLTLDSTFSKFGKIVNSNIKKGFAFVQFDNYESAKRAVMEMNGIRLGPRNIDVQFAKSNTKTNNGSRLKRKRDERELPRKKQKINQSSVYDNHKSLFNSICKVTIFVLEEKNKKMEEYSNFISSILKLDKISSDVKFISDKNTFLRTIPNEKYLLYVFSRNEANKTIYFCSVNDNGTSHGFYDTPIAHVSKFIQKDVLMKQMTTKMSQISLYPQVGGIPFNIQPQGNFVQPQLNTNGYFTQPPIFGLAQQINGGF